MANIDSINHGVLNDRQIAHFIDCGIIQSDRPIDKAQIQPASLDLRLGSIAYRLPASILPGKSHSINAVLDEFSMHSMSLEEGAVLEKNCVYIIPLREDVNLPNDIDAIANAKSTTGRLDVFTRLITNEAEAFDRIPAGYSGPLYAEVSPRSFSVLVRPNMRLNQIRFRKGRVQISDHELQSYHQNDPLVNSQAHIEDGIGFSVDLSQDLGEAVGYRAKPHTGLIDLDKLNYYKISDFWEPVFAKNERIVLDPGAFYILASQEQVRVPVDFACEMAPYLALVGEFRVHYAGFFDPGFGLNSEGSRGVLEVRCHEAPFMLNHGQRVGRLSYEKMSETPQNLYGSGIGSNYQGQKLRLAKQFSQK